MNDLVIAEAIELIEVLEDAKNFAPIIYGGTVWDLSHLDSFAFRLDPDLGFKIDVVVIFSCHCFTHSIHKDSRPRNKIPDAEIYADGREERVLDTQRYELSKRYLKDLVTGLPARRIIVANDNQRNFMTWDIPNLAGTSSTYAVFFDTEKDKERKRRVLLRIQSAYILDNGLTRRQKGAKKVTWPKLLKATYKGDKIRA